MAAASRRHPLYILFLLLMTLLCAAGIALVVYGAVNNGVPAPKMPGIAPRIAWVPHG